MHLKYRLRNIETDRAKPRPWTAPLNVVRFTQPPYGTIDAAEWAPSTASRADIDKRSWNVR
jgi:hypothetical protein